MLTHAKPLVDLGVERSRVASLAASGIRRRIRLELVDRQRATSNILSEFQCRRGRSKPTEGYGVRQIEIIDRTGYLLSDLPDQRQLAGYQ